MGTAHGKEQRETVVTLKGSYIILRMRPLQGRNVKLTTDPWALPMAIHSHAFSVNDSAMEPQPVFTSHPAIRRGTLRDAELLAELGARTFSETFADDNTPENMAMYLAAVFSPTQLAADLVDPRCVFEIAETDGLAVGYAMLRTGAPPEQITGERPIELVRLYVSRDCLGSGVGAALMQVCIDEAKRGGHETLWLGVWEHNNRAQAFYRKWNFRDVGTHLFQLGDDPQTDLLMQRSITLTK